MESFGMGRSGHSWVKFAIIDMALFVPVVVVIIAATMG
jgi:hypothetical protein